MKNNDLKQRTKLFALNIIELTDNLPRNQKSWIISKQILRSATSTAANYRAACRARSDKEFLAKINIVLEEADETLFWLEIIDELNLLTEKNNVEKLKVEADQLVAIFVSTLKTMNNKKNS